MLQCTSVWSRKVLCCLIVATLTVSGWMSPARAGTTTVTLSAGSVRATVNGRATTMLVPPVIDGPSQQMLVPIGFMGRQFGYAVCAVQQGLGLQLTRGQDFLVVSVGNRDVRLGSGILGLAVPPKGLLGEVLVAVSDVQVLLHLQVTPGANGAMMFSETIPDREVDGAIDADAVTYETRREQVYMQTVDFDIVRIDLTGKGIHVVSCQSIGGVGTGRYPSAFVDGLKPLAMMNATPFNLQTYIMSGSVQDQGTPVYYSGTYVSTIGITPDNVPFYVEGTARAVVQLNTGKNLTVSRINQSPAGPGSQTLSLFTNYYNGGLSVGTSELLVVVAGGRIVTVMSGRYFTPRTLAAGQVALYARHPDTVTLLRTASAAEVRSFVGDRDCTGCTFLQCGPVVVRSGKPFIDYARYKDISRTSKLGSRAFLGMDDRGHLYFIVTPAKVRLQFGDVSVALARLGLFTNVVTLDGGASTTLYYKGQYIIKGTRALTNVLCVPSS